MSSTYEKTELLICKQQILILQSKYDENRQITPTKVTVNNSAIVGDVHDTYSDKHWKDNVGFKVVGISVADGGSGYGLDPEVTISGGGGTGAYCKSSCKSRSNQTNRSNKCPRRIFDKSTVTVANFNAGGTQQDCMQN